MKRILAALAVLLSLAGSAIAGPAEDWQAANAAVKLNAPVVMRLYRVVGVFEGDRLNVRGWAGVQSEPVGAFSPDEQEIVVTGNALTVEGSVWWEIVYPHGITSQSNPEFGWVNSRYLAASDGLPAAERDYWNYPIECSGDEPFWDIRIESDQARFNYPYSGEDERLTAGQWSGPSGYSYSAAVPPGNMPFLVRLQRGQELAGFLHGSFRECLYHEGDHQMSIVGTYVFLNGKQMIGCCRRIGR